MERTCKICDRIFTTPYTLRRHYERFHPLESQPKLLRMSRKVYGNEPTPKLDRQCRSTLRRVNGVEDVSMRQYGGSVLESSDGDDDSDDDGASMVNNVGSDSDVDSGSESDTDVDSVDDGDDQNWVFDSLIEDAEAELGNNATLQAIRKLFRRKLADKIEWYHNLHRNTIYRKIIATAKELQDGPGDYDRNEALRVAIRQRRTLLDRLVPGSVTNDESDEDGGTGQGADTSDEGDGDSDDTEENTVAQ